MDRQAFWAPCDKIVGRKRENNGIGTLSEKTLHAVLKEYYEPYGANHEVRIGNYFADIVGENGIIEIQTRSLYKLIKKLDCFLEFCDVTVVYPIAAKKYVCWLDAATGEFSGRRKSPRKGTIYDAVGELYSIKFTLDNPRMHIRIPLIEAEDIRYLNGRGKNRRRGSSRCDRIPIDLLDEIELDSPEDFRIFIPQGLTGEFTSKDLAKAAKIHLSVSQTLLNILNYLGLVKKVSKKGNLIIYREIF